MNWSRRDVLKAGVLTGLLGVVVKPKEVKAKKNKFNPKYRFETVSISKITYSERMRVPDKEMLEQLKESIGRLGQVVHITVDSNYHLIDGRLRLLALTQLGKQTVEVMVLPDEVPKSGVCYNLIPSSERKLSHSVVEWH